MDLNNLLNESANGFKSLQADAARLAEKWTATGLLEGLSNEQEQNSMAMILENQAKELIKEASQTGTGGTFNAAGGEQWAGVALPLVRKVFAQIAAKDFVSVQPMNLPSGLVFYLDFKYGTANGGRTVNENMYGNVSNTTKMGVDVDASGGLYGAGQFGYSINEKELTITTNATGSATSASVNYQDGVNPGDYFTVGVDMSSVEYDSKGVRAFRLLSGSTDITSNPELTTVSGDTVTFVVLESSAGLNAGTVTGKVQYALAPKDNARGDFEDGTSANGTISIPEINVELAS